MQATIFNVFTSTAYNLLLISGVLDCKFLQNITKAETWSQHAISKSHLIYKTWKISPRRTVAYFLSVSRELRNRNNEKIYFDPVAYFR